MQGYYVKTVGQHRGAPRVWLEGTAPAGAGFAPGTRYDIEIQGQMVVLQANSDGSRVVSGKQIGERNNPIIDINSKALLAMFDGMAAIRVVAKKGEIYLMPLASELKKRERYQRLRQKLENGEPLDIGSASHGGGVLTHAIHAGLRYSGIESRLRFANEIREELLEHAAVHNDAWTDETQVLAAPMQELAFDARGLASIPKVEIWEAGIPCSGASSAGRSKRGLANPEAHPHVGHLVVSALVIISRANPAIVLIENVPLYGQSASADILRNQLRDMGYKTHERILSGKDWGTLENRDRWCLVATTEGIEFDFTRLQPPGASPQLIADVLDKNIGPGDARWRSFDYLRAKEVRDSEKGNGFAMQVVSAEGDSVPVLRKGYAKLGSTDALLQHPTDPKLMRGFTPAEHSRIKGIPESLIEGLSDTVAHQVLGQSIVYPVFQAVGAHMGNSLNALQGKPVVELPGGASTQSPVAMVQEANEPQAAPPSPQQQLFFEEQPVASGRYSGQVLSVVDEIATQRINREGATVRHDSRLLSEPVHVGEVIDITYENGLGKVGGKALAAGIGR